MSIWWITLLSFAGLCHANVDQPVVELKLGKVLGQRIPFRGKSIDQFLGIPYAVPPVGGLRFRKPLPVTSPWPKVFRATQLPNSCFQCYSQFERQSEDCLHLNVWTPSNGDTSDSQLKPVLFWIHGGAFCWGSTSSKVYKNGTVLSSLGDVVVVTINYRLGAFGFLYGQSDQAPGNVGLHDQILAMEWVKDNIAYFGGDPAKVTIFGESAGGASVSIHLLSTLSRPFFRHAIIMSGSPLVQRMVNTKSHALTRALNLAKLVNCSNSASDTLDDNAVECLVNADAKTIVAMSETSQVMLGSDPWNFKVIYGDEILPMSPVDLLKLGRFKKDARVLVGGNQFEGSVAGTMTLFNPNFPQYDQIENKLQWKSNLQSYINNSNTTAFDVEDLSALYLDPVADNEAKELRASYLHAMGDQLILCPTYMLSEYLAKDLTVYGYFINFIGSAEGSKFGAPTCEYQLGTCHAYELQYLFGLPMLYQDKYTDIERQMSELMIAIWATFAATGRPMEFESAINWGPYKRAKSGQILRIQYVINPGAEKEFKVGHKYVACHTSKYTL